MKILVTSCLLWASLVVDTVAFGANSLNDKMVIAEDNLEPVNLKYLALLIKNKRPVCAGSLISPRHILSAGGCIHILLQSSGDQPQLSKVTAYIGETEHKIIHAVYHDSFKPKRAGIFRLYDVGLALIEGLIFASDKVTFAILSKEWVRDNTVAEIVGWGNVFGSSPSLRKMNVKVEARSFCKKAYCQSSYKQSRMICGSKVNSNDELFKFDSGSPLIQNGSFVGILPFRVKKSRKPLIFLRACWIRQYVEDTKEHLNQFLNADMDLKRT